MLCDSFPPAHTLYRLCFTVIRAMSIFLCFSDWGMFLFLFPQELWHKISRYFSRSWVGKLLQGLTWTNWLWLLFWHNANAEIYQKAYRARGITANVPSASSTHSVSLSVYLSPSSWCSMIEWGEVHIVTEALTQRGQVILPVGAMLFCKIARWTQLMDAVSQWRVGPCSLSISIKTVREMLI